MKLLFYTKSYSYLAKKLKKHIKIAKIERKSFSDNEAYIRILEDVKGKDVFILGGTVSDADTMDLFDLGCAISMYGARTLNFIIPYFGYSTMERADLSGEVVKAKTRARIFSSIPRANEGNTIYLFDLHTKGILHYFENGLHSKEFNSKDIIKKIVSKIKGDKVLASPDAGRAKTIEKLSSYLNIPNALLLKQRSKNKVETTAINADVKGKTVIIYDDMIRSGKTIMSAAQAYKDKGAKEIYVITSHGLFTNQDIFNSDLIKKVYSTDSHININKIKNKKLKVYSIKNQIKKIIKEKNER